MGIDRFYLSEFREVVFEQLPYFEEQEDGNEYVYVREMSTLNDTKVILKIYSSVDTRTEKARKEGSDAIRIKFETKDGETIALNGYEYKKILRQSGWENRLNERINEYMNMYPRGLKMCDCGRPMALKNKNGSWFAGCTGWDYNNPKCENTENL